MTTLLKLSSPPQLKNFPVVLAPRHRQQNLTLMQSTNNFQFLSIWRPFQDFFTFHSIFCLHFDFLATIENRKLSLFQGCALKMWEILNIAIWFETTLNKVLNIIHGNYSLVFFHIITQTHVKPFFFHHIHSYLHFFGSYCAISVRHLTLSKTSWVSSHDE